ncbi:O-antigen ligase family protein [Carboxylicivirga taeanensis]|uniref:O-antigen ligase family protein n=1 Tax=Carboxylicivirga taeanensis TaxID=1416875 RepID=UPI003F6E0C60
MKINTTKITDYLLVYLLVAFSGIPFFYRARVEVLLVCMLFPLAVFIYRRKRIDKLFIAYVVVAMVIQAGQMLKFYYLPMTSFLGLHIRLLFAYLIIRTVGTKFPAYFITLLVVSVVISWLFYFPSYISSFESLLTDRITPLFEHPFYKASNYKVPDNLIVYTANTKGEAIGWLKRNSGPFWEPGAFAGFIIVALLFNVIMSKQLLNRNGVLLMAGLITTFSTSGLVVLGLLITVYVYFRSNLLKRLLLLPVLLIVFITLYNRVDFIGAKIQSKIAFTSQTYNTRFKSGLTDLKDLTKSPFVGLGQAKETRFAGETDERTIHRNNGVTNFLATFGLVGFSLYFILMYSSFQSLCNYYGFDRRFAVWALLIILMIGFSEEYFSKVFFMALSMMVILFAGRDETIDKSHV